MVAMMLVVNYAEKDKKRNFLCSNRFAGSARSRNSAAQRSAAAQQTAGGAARVDLCVPVRCSASARAATAMALPAVASSCSASNAAARPPPAAFPIRKQPAAQ